MGLINFLKNKFGKKKPEENYVKGLAKSRAAFSDRLALLAKKHAKLTPEYFEELETILIESDVGVSLTLRLIDELLEKGKENPNMSSQEANDELIDMMFVSYVEKGESIVNERGISHLVDIDSAGISGYHAGDLPDQRMRVHARRRGLELIHRSRQVRPADFERFDLIFAMDDSNYDHLRDMANSPEEMDKVVRIASFFRQHSAMDCIPDPYYGGSEGFENVLDLLEDACHHIADRIEEGTL